MSSASLPKHDEEAILNSPEHQSLVDDLNEDIFDEDHILGGLDATLASGAAPAETTTTKENIVPPTGPIVANHAESEAKDGPATQTPAASSSLSRQHSTLDEPELDYDEEPASTTRIGRKSYGSDYGDDDEEDDDDLAEQKARREKFNSERNRGPAANSRHTGRVPPLPAMQRNNPGDFFTSNEGASPLSAIGIRPRPGGKVLINPRYRGTIRPQANVRLSWDPSLASHAGHPGMIQMGAVKVIPPRPIGPGPIPRFNAIFPPAMSPYSMQMQSGGNRMPGIVPVRPVLGGGIAGGSIGMTSSMPVRPQHAAHTGGDWNSLVDGFLRKNASHRPHRSSSPPGASSPGSRSGSSRSSSFCSTCTSYSRSSSSQRSRSPIAGGLRGRRRSASDPRAAAHRRPPLSQRRVTTTTAGARRYERRVDDGGDRQTQHEHRRHRPRAGPRNGAVQGHRMQQASVSRMESTKECAAAIGLDTDDYLGRMEQQKKLRDEILRQKEQRRHEQKKPGQQSSSGPTTKVISSASAVKSSSSLNTKSLRNNLESRKSQSTNIAARGDDVGDKRNVRTRQPPAATMQSSSREEERVSVRERLSAGDATTTIAQSSGARRVTSSSAVVTSESRAVPSRTTQRASGSGGSSNRSGKRKAYLAVKVENLGGWPDALSRLQIVADTIGRVKKIWQSSGDTVSIVFEDLDKAKQFMLQYNLKKMSGIELRVRLEKIFENLAELR